MHQTYREAGLGFDVRRAKAYLRTHEVPVLYVPASALSAWMQQGPTGRRNPRAGRIRPSRLPIADPEVPLILAETPKGGYLIDGHHRLERGRALGRAEFPIVVIADRPTVMWVMRGLTSPLRFWWLWRGLTRAGASRTEAQVPEPSGGHRSHGAHGGEVGRRT